MGNGETYTNTNCRSLFFIILFLVFALICSDKSASLTSQSIRYSSHYELTNVNDLFHFDATISSTVSLPDLYKYGVNAINNNRVDLFSLQFIISGYNLRITRIFTDLEKSTLEIVPLFLRRLSYYLSFREKGDLPLLS